MARMSRVVAVGTPHHVIQRGNRRQNVFLKAEDKAEYLKILKLQSELFGLQVWAYCLMDNHVHLIVVPSKKESLTKAIGETHQLYTRMINFREGWRGYLWQGRFHSFPLDERYLVAAVRYVERNPLRAGIVEKAEDYTWSSAKAHVENTFEPVLSEFYLTKDITDWKAFLAENEQEKDLKLIRRHGHTGRPLGHLGFIRQLENDLGMELEPKKPGRKKLN